MMADNEEVLSEEEVSENVDDVVADPIEDIARKAGWKPKEDWQGDDSGWKPASDFLANTVDVNQAQKRQIKDLNTRLDRLSSSVETVVSRTVAQERSKWEQQFEQAVEEGDTSAAKKAADELKVLDSQPVRSDDAQAFAEKHKDWFNVDPYATQIAFAAAEQAAKLGKSTAEQLSYAEQIVSQRFPELFPSAKTEKPPAQVAEQVGRMARPVKRERGFVDLPPEAKQAALQFEKKGVKRDEYAAEYWKGVA
jgi:hypothetical protein